MDLLLRDRFRMAELLIGHDHGFGRGRAGDVDTLRTLGAERGFAVDVVAPVETSDGQPVSSTRIRRAVAAGDLDRPRRLSGDATRCQAGSSPASRAVAGSAFPPSTCCRNRRGSFFRPTVYTLSMSIRRVDPSAG